MVLSKILFYISILIDFAIKLIDRGLMYIYISRFKKIGKNVKFFPINSNFIYSNISIGNDVVIGPRANFMSYIAKIHIGDKVLFGPNVTIRGGIHPYYIVGRFIFDIGENEKSPSDDQDVIIESDVWIGTNVTILKGVTIARGSIVAAGAVVTKNVFPYTIVGGVPARKLRNRFDSFEDLKKHESALYPVELQIDINVLYNSFNIS